MSVSGLRLTSTAGAIISKAADVTLVRAFVSGNFPLHGNGADVANIFRPHKVNTLPWVPLNIQFPDAEGDDFGKSILEFRSLQLAGKQHEIK